MSGRSLALGAVMTVAAVATATEATAAEPTKAQCIAANGAAQPLRRSGKLRDARTQLRVCVSSACPGPVRDDCAQRLDEVERALPTVVFVVTGDDGKDLSAVSVRMDGAPFADRLDGAAIPADPGEHKFAFAADGFGPVEQTVLLREGDKAVRQRVVMRSTSAPPAASTATPPTTPASTPPPALPATPPDGSAGGSGAPVAAYTVLGIGAAGAVAATVFGVLALGNKSSLDKACGSSKSACPAASQSDIDGLHRNSLLSDVGLGVAVVGAGVGVLLLLLHHGRADDAAGARAAAGEVTPWLGLGAAGLRGSFQ